MTLEEEVAEKMAQLLIEAARARELAAPHADQAAELETEVMKWEQRLNWWKRLRERKSPKP